MKLSIKSGVVGLILTAIVASASAFTSPNGEPMGVLSDGTYWLAKNLVDPLEGSTPKLKSLADNWGLRKMTLDNTGKYYTVKGKPCKAGFTMDYCFDIGGDHFIPHALVQISDQSLLDKIGANEIVPNGNVQFPGFNFRTIVVAGTGN